MCVCVCVWVCECVYVYIDIYLRVCARRTVKPTQQT